MGHVTVWTFWHILSNIIVISQKTKLQSSQRDGVDAGVKAPPHHSNHKFMKITNQHLFHKFTYTWWAKKTAHYTLDRFLADRTIGRASVVCRL